MRFFIFFRQSVISFLSLVLLTLTAGGLTAFSLDPSPLSPVAESSSAAAGMPEEATPTHQSARHIVEGVEHFQWFIQRTRLQPGPWNINVLTVDLTRPDIRVRVVEAEGEETVSDICRRVGALAAVNAQALTEKNDALLLITEGKIQNASPGLIQERATLGFYKKKAWLDIVRTENEQLIPLHPTRWFDWDRVESAVAVGPRLGFGGKVLLDPEREGYGPEFVNESESYAPRTAVGLQKNRLILATVDGRQPKLSIGMTMEQIAGFLISRRNALYAMALDGGESTTMVIDGLVVNSPAGRDESGRPGREQPVRSAICIFGPEERILE